MKQDKEKYFKHIWDIASNKSKIAGNSIINPDELCSRGDIEVLDKRHKFTKWLIRTKKGFETDRGVYVSSGGGQWYFRAKACADAFCKVLKHYGIKYRNEVTLD